LPYREEATAQIQIERLLSEGKGRRAGGAPYIWSAGVSRFRIFVVGEGKKKKRKKKKKEKKKEKRRKKKKKKKNKKKQKSKDRRKKKKKNK